MAEVARTLVIPQHWNGPDGTGNGGYTSGLLAASFGGSDVEVRLQVPPPLDTLMSLVETAGESLELHHHGAVIARARRRPVEVEVPLPVSVADATAAAELYPGLVSHAFPHCVVCGTHRTDGLGLRPGPVAGRAGLYATPWTPGTVARIRRTPGAVPAEVVWAALDCPSGWACAERAHDIVVLGTMTARMIEPVRPGATHVVVGWPRDSGEGRRHLAGSAVFRADGTLCAVAESVWVTLPG